MNVVCYGLSVWKEEGLKYTKKESSAEAPNFRERISVVFIARRYLPDVRNEWPGRREAAEFAKKRG